MFIIQTFNHIAPQGLALFDKQTFQIGGKNPQALLLRSHKLHIDEIAASVLAVGRAGAGTNNIPVNELTARGVPVFNTPGANANAVKELVIAGLLIASRNLSQAWQFVQTLPKECSHFNESIEAGKKQFKGQELAGKVLGVIGLGAIGVKVANTALALGMKVIGYDPALSVQRAWEVSAEVSQVNSLEELLRNSEFVSIHVPLTEQTKHLLHEQRLRLLPAKATLLNFSRQEVVDEPCLNTLLQEQRLQYYVSDFPNPELVTHPHVLALPHLGASTSEAEEHCALMVAQQIKDFLQQGLITNSVNFPEVTLAIPPGACRLTISHANIPAMVAQTSTLLGQAGLNIIDLVNRSREEVAYSLFDVDKPIAASTLNQIAKISGIFHVRSIE